MIRCDCDTRIGEGCRAPWCHGWKSQPATVDRGPGGRYRLRVKRHFDAAHHLPDHDGKCANIHGHRWDVEVEVTAKSVGSGGMVVDFADVKDALDDAMSDMDHGCLNDLPEFQIVPPTAENVATVLFGRMRSMMRGVVSVTVWESPDASVTLRIDGGE